MPRCFSTIKSIFSKLVLWLCLSTSTGVLADVYQSCEVKAELPFEISAEELYERLPTEGRIDKEKFFRSLERLPDAPVWRSELEEKFYYAAKDIDYIILARISSVFSEVWPNSSLFNLTKIKDIELIWEVLNVYKMPDNKGRVEESIRVKISSGYLYSGKSAMSVYELVDRAYEYERRFRRLKQSVQSDYIDGKISIETRDKKLSDIDELYKAHEYYGGSSPFGNLTRFDDVYSLSRLCGLPFLQEKTSYLLFLRKAPTGVYELEGVQAIFPASFSKLAKKVTETVK